MSQTVGRAGGAPELLLRIDLTASVFASNWAYCDRISSYVARMISHNRTDSLLHANLFSSAFNELLETVHRFHDADGDFVCEISRAPRADRIALTIPCGVEDTAFYEGALARLREPGLAEAYRAALFADGPLDPGIGLMELAVDYGAKLSIEPAGEGSIRLVADLSLEEDKH